MSNDEMDLTVVQVDAEVEVQTGEVVDEKQKAVEEALDKISSIIGVPSSDDFLDSLSMKLSDKSHIIPKFSQEVYDNNGALRGLSIFDINENGDVLIDGMPEREYFENHNMDFLDMWPLRTIYSCLFDKFKDKILSSSTEDLTAEMVMNFTARLSLDEMVKSYMDGKLNAAHRERLLKSIAAYSGIAGKLPSVVKKGKNDVFAMLLWEGTLADGTFIIKSPYLNFLMLHCLRDSFQFDKKRVPKFDYKGYHLTAPNTSYLFKSTINKGRYGISREFAYVICQVIELAGSRPGTVPHISARELIHRVPQFEYKLMNMQRTSNKNTTLQRAFLRTWEILEKETILTERYKNIKFPDSYPTMGTLDTVYEFPHDGKIKEKRSEKNGDTEG